MIYNIFFEGSYVSTMYSVQDVIEYMDVNGLKVVYEKEYFDGNTVDIFTYMDED